jgi:two-component system OmpR family response regulator
MAAKTHSEDSAGTASSNGTVLFVDDEPEILDMYELLCQSEYTVRTAQTGAGALEQFGDQVDIAFFDRRMPDVSGYELIEEIRSEGYKTPLGVISAVEPDSGPDAEIDAYLTKPISGTDLTETIDEHTG